MRFLLDTHTFFWFVFGDGSLPLASRNLIEDPGNGILLSLASVWEATIKYGLGKLYLDGAPEEFFQEQMERNSVELLSITPAHIYGLLNLPSDPRDPFDRLIAAQCRAEGLAIVSGDRASDEVGITRIWA